MPRWPECPPGWCRRRDKGGRERRQIENRERKIDVAVHEARRLREHIAGALELKTDHEIARLLYLHQKEPRAQRVRRAARDDKRVARVDGDLVEALLDRRDILRDDIFTQLRRSRRALETDVDAPGGFRVSADRKHVISLRLAARSAEHPLRKLPGRVDLEMQPGAAVERDQRRVVHNVGLTARAPESARPQRASPDAPRRAAILVPGESNPNGPLQHLLSGHK